MIKKNQYYRLVDYNIKEKKAKVYNFRTNNIEIYSTVLTRRERFLQKNKRLELERSLKAYYCKKLPSNSYGEYSSNVQNIEKSFRKGFVKKKKFRNFLAMVCYSGFYNKYNNCFFLSKNKLFYSLIIYHFLKYYKKSIFGVSFNIFCIGYKYKLNKIILNNRFNCYLDIISIYVILRRNNIFVTIVKNNNKILKIFSPCIFSHIPKRGRKKSASFFYTVKRTLIYLRRFIFFKKRKYFFKIFFKGFQIFRRPLISRFLYNKRLKLRCLGIYNLDFEAFNGCRLRKSKRIKIKGQRKQKKRFSF